MKINMRYSECAQGFRLLARACLRLAERIEPADRAVLLEKAAMFVRLAERYSRWHLDEEALGAEIAKRRPHSEPGS